MEWRERSVRRNASRRRGLPDHAAVVFQVMPDDDLQIAGQPPLTPEAQAARLSLFGIMASAVIMQFGPNQVLKFHPKCRLPTPLNLDFDLNQLCSRYPIIKLVRCL
jgi:hypothetical protein